MSKDKIFLVVIILGVAVLSATVAFIFLKATTSSPLRASLGNNSVGQTDEPNSSANGYELEASDEAEVAVEVIPENLGVKLNKNIFDVAFNTHSVDLNYDFAKISTLKDDQGGVYEAEAWSGGASGHHLSGKLIFPKISATAKSVQLEIDNINGVKRIFAWQLK